jgi:hypothetical protein
MAWKKLGMKLRGIAKANDTWLEQKKPNIYGIVRLF